MKILNKFLFTSLVLIMATTVSANDPDRKIADVYKINPNTIEIKYANDRRMILDFYGNTIFRVFQDNNGGSVRNPEAKPEADILVDNPRREVSDLNINKAGQEITIATSDIRIVLNTESGLMKVINIRTNNVVIEELAPALFADNQVTLTLKENADEYFYGGGVQNGRFSHKGKAISIENQNSWTDGGVASPTPFYWSTKGYGVMWHTFKKGEYDFGAKEKGVVKLYHESPYLDVFFMVGDGAIALLNGFYQLTGNPVLLPKFGFYQGHLNAYNRDYWKEDTTGVKFEDGKTYKESQKDNGGIKESLNGELNNYQFSGRAVIDRYKNHDMPLGWLLPNDGYGAGYGQTETLAGNIQNLKNLADYAHKNGVEIGLWTQSDLHPKEGVSALLQRDIVGEVRDAGVRVLKTDVAWVGAGYSFGLNGIADVANIMTYYGQNSRPFIISLDGWAGTQRYAGIWSGDQTGGVWEYIRFHIPTYIGSGLSGQPNISSDMDGIFGGLNPAVNIRDFQWKTWSPMELNMDGWGRNEKYPHALGEPATSINRWYLKLKSELMPYTYSIAKESVDGLPMIRAMFLEYPNAYTYGKATQYQYLFGPCFLIAPIWQETKADKEGNDIRDHIYLPEGTWIDYFTGDKYEGSRVLNNFDSPLWKLPVFVKNGAIIPMTNPNNNVSEINKHFRAYEFYPAGYNTFTEYDDDGTTQEYRAGKGVTTVIESNVDIKNNATLTIHPATGSFAGFVKEKVTEFRVNVSEKPRKVSAVIGKSKAKLEEVSSMDEFLQKENVYFYDATPDMNKFATKGSEFAKVTITKNPMVLIKLASSDISANKTVVRIENFVFNPVDKSKSKTGPLAAPLQAQLTDENTEAYQMTPTWSPVANADYYEIEFNDMLYTGIRDTVLLFDGLEAETSYSFKLRSVNKEGHSGWTTFGATTKTNPLEFAIQHIAAECSVPAQGGEGIRALFDFDEGNSWHTRYSEKAPSFDIIMDMKTINQLDKINYLPRSSGLNGVVLEGVIYHSFDKDKWEEAGAFAWDRNNDVKTFTFQNKPTARYIRMSVSKAVGDFGSGREMYVFKVPGTESYLPGDINNDRLVDQNDLTSYTNYTGLRRGDADFEGYISNGDLNKNDLIDAYDISVVATQLEGGVKLFPKKEKVNGSITLNTARQNYAKDEIIEIKVTGKDLVSVNALSFAIQYDPQAYEYTGIEVLSVKDMENLTNDRLHTNGVKSVYPTFVNLGDKETIDGSVDLFILKFKAKQKIKFDLKATDIILVDKQLNVTRP